MKSIGIYRYKSYMIVNNIYQCDTKGIFLMYNVIHDTITFKIVATPSV